jgi:hypothetical protein
MWSDDMRLFSTSLILVLAALGSGCANISEAGYFWGNYSYTYLETIRDPSTKSNEKHTESLRKIIAESEERKLKPPPGVNAELAFWLLKLNPDSTEAEGLFEREVEVYPESRIFIERLLAL